MTTLILNAMNSTMIQFVEKKNKKTNYNEHKAGYI